MDEQRYLRAIPLSLLLSLSLLLPPLVLCTDSLIGPIQFPHYFKRVSHVDFETGKWRLLTYKIHSPLIVRMNVFYGWDRRILFRSENTHGQDGEIHLAKVFVFFHLLGLLKRVVEVHLFLALFPLRVVTQNQQV